MFDHDTSAPPALGPAGATRITSPCLGDCTLDAATGWCRGCGRSGEEIAGWGHAAPARRAAVWQALPGRLATLGAALMRADATPEAAASAVGAALSGPLPRLSLALHGTVLDVCTRGWRVTVAGPRVLAEGASSRLDWRFAPSLRLLRPVGDTLPAGLLVLAVQTMAGLPPDCPLEGWRTLAASPTLRLRRADGSGALRVETVFGALDLDAMPAPAGGLPALPPACLPVAMIDPDGEGAAVAAPQSALAARLP